MRNLPLRGTVHAEKRLVDENDEFKHLAKEILRDSPPVLHLDLPPGSVFYIRFHNEIH